VKDDRVWIIKAHYPYIYPYAVSMSAGKAVVLVRNPFDMIVSLF